MRLNLIGINHQTAPVGIREAAALNAEKLPDYLSDLHIGGLHCVIISTCNRTEIYTTDDDGGGIQTCYEFLRQRIKVSGDTLKKYIYQLKDDQAVSHLFRVACGLDSMILGEYEVLGQLGQALELAEAAGAVDLSLRQIFQSALRTGRRVREETGISKNAVSVSSVAVDLATKIVGDFGNCRMLVVGAGEAGRLVAKVAHERGTSQIVVANRTKERAAALATSLGGRAADMLNLVDETSNADIIVTCATAPHWILTVPQIEEAMTKRSCRPLVIVDIAVPRNVEPLVKDLKDVFLYNIDDLTGISELNRKQREGEIQKATSIMTEELDKLASWWQVMEVTPVVSALTGRAENIRRQQMEKTLKKLNKLSDEERQNLEAMTKAIVMKILNDPIQYLKTNHCSADVIKEMFNLEKQS